jgi:hypothetical protein
MKTAEKKKKKKREAPSSLGRDGKLSPPIRWKRDGAVQVGAGGGSGGSVIEQTHYRPPTTLDGYRGGSGLRDPEMTPNEYLGVSDDAEKTAIVRRAVLDQPLVDDRELRDVIRAERRRGTSGGSWDRNEITIDHAPVGGRRAYHAGQGSTPLVTLSHNANQLKLPSVSKLKRSMRKATKARKEAAMAEQRTKDELTARRAAWPAVRVEALARGASDRQMEAYRLVAVEGLSNTDAALKMRISEKNVRKLFDKSTRYVGGRN